MKEGKVVKIEPRIGRGDEQYIWKGEHGSMYGFILTFEDGHRATCLAQTTNYVACQVGDTIEYHVKYPANKEKELLESIVGVKVKGAPVYGNKSSSSGWPSPEETIRMVAFESALLVETTIGTPKTDDVVKMSETFVEWITKNGTDKKNSMISSNALRRAADLCIGNNVTDADSIVIKADTVRRYIVYGLKKEE